ncbi:carbohydrate ABC transporter permease [Microbacterium sp. EYE_5]|uniref:carbohydrate ABC transporter permease n=1 Tax=unclassified Microbacterium TaxID=2609290 RepID=UPI0020064687|nr:MULTISPECIES: carbohydrate ABC transporter permease [unclassified Microbacterium]MCK6079269.1 carbohydrate ABC transporter permease [Microbacterium sp. EYE_382]MCK6084539.1 carbohydrate ABC transporter permease [Microbacterium sp. EYE_384]MCK6123232.1 carbohydrate ABC transporter permease [Microbacterium sp. EYE_80]MCK6125303.1 carbohydrate ABC transporter permease [Microbacterium sp. EYE_79]MCK6140223.1 carbohydrate ABC transporter permease [Microbacterium sp. EYE_39]
MSTSNVATTSGAASTPVFAAQQTIPAPPRKKVNRKTWQTVVWLIGLIALTALVLYPLVWLAFSTFKPNGEFGQNSGLLPNSPTFDNYTKVLEGIAGVPLWKFFWNSLILAVAAVVGTVLSSALAAYAFARIQFKGLGILFAAMIGTLLLPFHVVIIPQYILFNNFGLVDTFWPLILPKFLATEAFFVFLLVQFMRQMPRDMDEAARIDGAGHVRIFWAIILPLVKPALITCAIFAFIWSWNDFLGPLLYLTSPENYPLPIALRLYNDQSSTSDYGATVTASFLALLPVLIFFLVFQRFLVDGVATQGLKG